MKFIVQTQNKFDGTRLMGTAGYHEHRDPYSGKMSFARRAGGESHYPRYHVYLSEDAGSVRVDLHLDQKKPSYGGGTHAHAGEYEGRVVADEAKRIQATADRLLAEPTNEPEPEKKSFFGKFFG